ncbi:MAG: penicillin acylase family protein [Balneolales bacterium]
MKSVLKFFLLIAILITGFVLMAVYLTFFNPRPGYNKDVQAEGIRSEVTVHRDDYGVPHLFACNEDDLYFALGYVHAQDRIWQMTLSQMTAEGRFAEFLGENFISLDQYLRVLGFQKTAATIWQEMPADQQKVLESYAAGVNAFAAQNKNRLPIEFALSGIRPIPWTPRHSIALSRIFAWEMNTSWWSKAVMGHLQTAMDPGTFEKFFLQAPDTTLTQSGADRIMDESLLPFLAQENQMREFFGTSGNAVGSNAWVAGGSITGSGFPLLAGDPHLGLSMPAKWYEVHLNLNGNNVSGATIPGAPVIIMGQNDFMSWSLTNIMADDTDFFVEKRHPDDPERYLADSLDHAPVYEDIVTVREIIKVRDSEEVLNEIRYTENGPVISDIHHKPGLPGNELVSMRWTGHDASNELGVLYGINWAGSFEEFQGLLPDFKVPGMNILYGDYSGNIALYVLGNFPQRTNPLNFRRGWSPDDDWQGYIPFDRLPHTVNPDAGWIANANNKLHDDDYPYYITSFWSSSSRFDRIRSLLVQGGDSLAVFDFMEMQNDIYSEHARDVTELILPILAEAANDEQIRTALSYLNNWDFKYAKNAGAASILDVFFMKLGENTLKDEMGSQAYESFVHLEYLPVNTLLQLLEESVASTKPAITNDEVLNSMKEAMTFLEDSLGTQSYEWRWENLHTLTFKPPFFNQASDAGAGKTSRLIMKNILSRGPYPVSGHGMSINTGQYSWGEPFTMTLGPSIRRVVDLSDLQKSYSVLSTGQSGNPISRHYDDQIPLWLEGRYRTFYHHQDGLSNYRQNTLIIRPQP